jgi:hypothetical protein
MVGKYVEGGQADHSAHSSNYERIARLQGTRIPFGFIPDNKVVAR